MILDNEDLMPGEDVYFWEEGKDKSGRLLDGVEYNDMPEVN